MFKIDIQNRLYDLHRPNGCTVLVIEVEQWPGNEFGLWLPEVVYCDDCDGGIAWCNLKGEVTQTWERTADTWAWSKALNGFTITSTLNADAVNRCLWYRHSFENHSKKEISGLSTATCFHLVNAPEFISIRGERIWACLDGNWTTTDCVPRHESPDPRRVSFLRNGIRTERTVVPSKAWSTLAIMPEAAYHPLIIAERFNANGAVGIACKNFKMLINNNDYILRCIHSEPFPLHKLLPGQRADQEGIILFSETGHHEIREHFEGLTSSQWKNENVPA